MIFWLNLLNRVINKIGKSQTIEQVRRVSSPTLTLVLITRILTMYNVSGIDLAGQFTLFQLKSPTKHILLS